MTAPKGPDATVALTQEHDRRFAFLHHRLRSAGYRIVADCERLLDQPAVMARPAIRDALGTALLAAKRLISLTTIHNGSDGKRNQHETQLNAGGQEAQKTIVTAMNGPLTLVAVSLDEELVLHDIRAIRDAARQLFSTAVPGEPAAPRRSETTPQTPKDRRFKVLVADDEDALRELLARAVTAMGYDVVKAKDGQAALEMALQESVDLVLTDINMPRLTGMELLQQLKSRPETRDVPVIVVSSESELTSVAKIIEFGAEDHIVKPYQPLLLRARVLASLERKRMRDLELEHQHRVRELTAAAEAVEQESYVPGSLQSVIATGDALGHLAQVFDRVVAGLKSREERLQRRLGQLRHEMAETTEQISIASASEESPFSTAERIASRYEIEGHIGKGGMGMVYRAKDLELGEEVAIKVIRGDLLEKDPAMLERLKSEIRLARRISHRNVVRLHDLGEWNGTYFITMEYVKGVTVANLLDRRGRLTVASTLAIGTQLCDALAVAHGQQIIHRDIKPANLLVDAEGSLKVMDFGIARSIDPGVLRLTTGGNVVGTPLYMAPEQLMGRAIDARADIFAVGVVLYECLAGTTPFVADSPLGLMTAIADENVKPLGDLVSDLPPQLGALVHKQLRFDARDRTQSASELAQKLAEIDSEIT